MEKADKEKPGIKSGRERERNTKFAKKYAKREGKGTRITGIAGAGHGVGVTHLTLLAANYMQSVRGRKTAVLEWNDHGDFLRFGRACTGRIEDRVCYGIQGVDYYPAAGSATLMECLAAEYGEVLIDFGSMEEQVSVELTRCGTVWIVVSFCEWQMDGLWELVKQEESVGTKSWQWFAAFGSEESGIEWNKRRKPSVSRIPFSADPFTITRETMNWMETAWKDGSFSGNVSRQNLLKWKEKER